MSRLIPLFVALLGVFIVIENRKCAGSIMDNHRQLRGAVKPVDEQRWFVIYRIIAVLSGCFLAVSGGLGALGMVAVRH